MTNNDQSARLIACGVDPKSADDEVIEYDSPFSYRDKKVTSAWSLSALLAMLPKEITDDNSDNYYLSIAQEFPLSYEYGVSYKPCWSDGDALTRTRDNCPIEACVQMIEWLTKNGYKLNNNG